VESAPNSDYYIIKLKTGIFIEKVGSEVLFLFEPPSLYNSCLPFPLTSH